MVWTKLAKAAASLGRDPFRAMHRRLLRAYFSENRDISDRATLRKLWDELELPPDAFERSEDPALLRLVIDEHNEAIECGASGVPAVRLEETAAVITGAQPIDLYRRWATRALES